MASLQVIKGPAPGQSIQLAGEKTVLGRDPTCQVVIGGTAVSRTHAHILKVEELYYLEDLKSRNGTLLNDEPVAARTLLKDSDRIKICDFVCVFHDSLKPLPELFRTEEFDTDDDTGPSSEVEAAISHLSSHVALEAQPAEKLKALLEITEDLSKTLELEPLLPKIVDSLFYLFRQADRGFIILRDPATQKLMPKVVKARRPHDEEQARFSRRIVNQCLESVQALLSDDAVSDSRFALSQSIADFRIRSVMCAPLWSQDGKAFGVIQLDSQDRNKKFTEDDLHLLVGVASQASIALENAKLHQEILARERLKRDVELARQVQRSFLPSRCPHVSGYEFYAHYESAMEVGGDYYDFIPLPGGRLAVMLGDVAGKGVAAALLMAKISSDARFCMLTESDPGVAVTRLNDQLHKAGLTDRFITLAAAVLDPAEHRVTLVNAGHPSPLVYRAGAGRMEEVVSREATGLPIGVAPDYAYPSCAVEVGPRDSLILFSDGITDAMDREDKPLQGEGFKAAVQIGACSPAALGRRVVQAVHQHAAGRSQHDDITLVSFGRLAKT